MRSSALAAKQLNASLRHHLSVMGLTFPPDIDHAVTAAVNNIAIGLDEFGYANPRPLSRDEIQEILMIRGIEELRVYRVKKTWWCRATGETAGIYLSSAQTPMDALVAVAETLSRDKEAQTSLTPLTVSFSRIEDKNPVIVKAIVHVNPTKNLWVFSQAWIDGTAYAYRPTDEELTLLRKLSFSKVDELQKQYLTDEYGTVIEEAICL